MPLVNTSFGRFRSDSVHSERKFHSEHEGRLVPILHLNGGHVHARSEHVFVVAHEKVLLLLMYFVQRRCYRTYYCPPQDNFGRDRKVYSD